MVNVDNETIEQLKEVYKNCNIFFCNFGSFKNIIANDGSVSMLTNIPKIYKNLYKTIWEIKQIWVLKHAKARAPFVDQTQSMNIFMAVPDYKKLNSCHMCTPTQTHPP